MSNPHKEKDQQVPQDHQQSESQQTDCETATSNQKNHQLLSSWTGFKQYWLVDLRVNTFVEAQLPS
jgi:hypothetical protein